MAASASLCTNDGPSEVSDALLPPLPQPERAQLRQSLGGCSLVLGIIVLFVAITLASALAAPMSDAATLGLIAAVGTESLVALVCLAGLLWGDPGVVRRTAATTTPVPPEVSALLAESKTPTEVGMRNLPDDEGRSYCVRCYVWRTPRPPDRGVVRCCHARWEPSSNGFHHCSVCQRCVADFDHHCGVFGRCIAGKRWQGNLKFFLAIILAGQAGALTALVAMCVAVASRWGAWALGPFFGALFCCSCVAPRFSPRRLINTTGGIIGKCW